jgi:hypothetical protein
VSQCAPRLAPYRTWEGRRAAFSSTIVDGERVRVDLNRVGMWFADPADDDFCRATPGTNG